MVTCWWAGWWAVDEVPACLLGGVILSLSCGVVAHCAAGWRANACAPDRKLRYQRVQGFLRLQTPSTCAANLQPVSGKHGGHC
jgi:hypothetical protein